METQRSMKFRFTPRALGDLDEAIIYLLRDNVEVARRFRHAVLGTITLVREYPYAGIKNARDPDFRSKITPGFRYRLHYTIMDNVIVIVHIRHTSRGQWNPGHDR